MITSTSVHACRPHPWLACIAALLMSGTVVSVAPAQDAVNDFLRYGDLVYAEAAQLPSDSGNACRLDVMIRIAYDYLVFVKSDRQHRDSTFTAGVHVAIDVLNDRSFTVHATDEKAILYAADFATTNTRDAYVLLKHSVYLEPGDYTVQIAINDAHSTRERRMPLPIRLRSAPRDSLAILSALPIAYRPSLDMPQVGSLGYGGRFLFASSTFIAVSAIAPAGTDWVFRLNRVTEDGVMPVWSDSLPPFMTHDNLSGGRRNGIVTGFGFDVYSGRLSASMRIFQLPFDTLDVGDYELEIAVAGHGAEDVFRMPFSVFWKDMPLTLKNPDLALGIMRYILSEEEYGAMDKGSDEERAGRIRAYWKGRDPSPGTPYNETMVEFFRRADQAYYKFQTTTIANGALTDRGKIYILYGPPDSVDRLLEPGGLPQEAWSYRTLGKTFRFVDRSRNGNLRLAP